MYIIYTLYVRTKSNMYMYMYVYIIIHMCIRKYVCTCVYVSMYIQNTQETSWHNHHTHYTCTCIYINVYSQYSSKIIHSTCTIGTCTCIYMYIPAVVFPVVWWPHPLHSSETTPGCLSLQQDDSSCTQIQLHQEIIHNIHMYIHMYTCTVRFKKNLS